MFMPIHEVMLRDALTALAEECKAQFQAICNLTDELNDLREAAHKADARILPEMERRRKTRVEDPARAASIRRLDDIIQRMRDHVIHDVKL